MASLLFKASFMLFYHLMDTEYVESLSIHT